MLRHANGFAQLSLEPCWCAATSFRLWRFGRTQAIALLFLRTVGLTLHRLKIIAAGFDVPSSFIEEQRRIVALLVPLEADWVSPIADSFGEASTCRKLVFGSGLSSRELHE